MVKEKMEFRPETTHTERYLCVEPQKTKKKLGSENSEKIMQCRLEIEKKSKIFGQQA